MIPLTLNELLNTKPDLGEHSDQVYLLLEELETVRREGVTEDHYCPGCESCEIEIEDHLAEIGELKEDITDLKRQLMEVNNH